MAIILAQFLVNFTYKVIFVCMHTFFIFNYKQVIDGIFLRRNRHLRNSFLLMFFCVLAGVSFGQNVITGKVLDKSSGLTMIGTNVVIKGTTIGTTTDVDGKFKLETDKKAPVTLVLSFLGYKTSEFVVTDFSKKVTIKMEADNVMLDAVEIVDTRISDRQKQAPLTVETMDVIAIKEAPSGNFYESLGNLKGVDMTSASLGFKVINTRGFNSTSPVRSLQLIDGVDNQSPGLNFSLGNFLGASDLDVKKVDIIAGASSAYYGPGAFNGVINMTTKDPFTFPGLSASVKVGERNLTEYAVRWAQVLKNKEGKEKFGYKLNIFYMQANDWKAENYDPIDGSKQGRNNPGGYNAVNRYGDESRERNNDYTDAVEVSENPGLGVFFRDGYREVDLADYNTKNLKLNAAAHYKIKDDLQLIYAFNYGSGTTIYHGDNRYSLKGIQFYQNKLELKKEDKFFIRAYATHEDAGDSYDIVTTALRMQEESASEKNWNSSYKTRWRLFRYHKKVEALPGYPRYIASEGPFDSWYNTKYLPFLQQHSDSLNKWHSEVRDIVNKESSSTMRPRFVPGTAAFDSLFNSIRSRKFTEGGSLFYDKSALYNVQGEYKFKPDWAEITIGANGRLYTPDTRGTIFSDTLQYTYGTNSKGETIKTDSSYKKIENREFGIYVGVSKKVLEERLKLNATVRVDKNENFDALVSPAISGVYTMNENHTFRLTFSSAIRNPTLADQYLNYNVGNAILVGNLNGYDSLITTESFGDYLFNLNRDTLRYFNVDPIQPEKVRTIEVGYRGLIKDKVYVDAGYYFSWYNDFIGYNIGVDATIDVNNFPSNVTVYRVAANARDQVTTQGFNIGLNYYLTKKLTLNGNYSWNKLDKQGSTDPIIPAFNTPENKYNVGIRGKDIMIPFLNLPNFGFGVNYKWLQGFQFEGSPQFTGFIDAYALVDAQVNYKFPKYHTTIKLGASNVLDNRIYQVYGGPRVGRLAYFSILFDWKNN